ncbi:Ig-like domain-containing protein [Parabacteroides sp. AM08-6]|uniref:Ig-like domain-containing protein n=1 Tax=Parabacteroides sp. AM08-6 TaxID=2292053 RepID=UPI000EFED08D|nr:Ig-like domain-containing protein [Parabacteroides sp. AM08-6]RHJ84870.1 hypothetical protein DW103_05330 [Parabacteroides sp. AM08-6]
MDNRYIRNSLRLLYGTVLLIFIYSCANIGSPNGGPYDETPPRFIGSLPSPNQTNYKGKKIEIIFDELIQIDKPSENVIITPPQIEMPVIRSAGRKVVVELKDTLKENTTYTIDFTNSIADNNEKNVFENFSFAFSTGDVIDSLEISGVLLNAENLEPMPGITIGLHSNLADSAFVNIPFVRTSRTNDRGHFTIRNIAPGTYRLFALNDVNRDYKFDQPGEDIAFLDSVIVPTFELATRQDTTWKDSLTIDTIRTVEFTRFLPEDVVLRLFKEKFVRQYMVKPERLDERYFTLRFNTELDTIPVPVPLNFAPEDSSWYFVQRTDGGASVNYWLTDSMVWKQDTLQMQVTYPKSDSLNILRPQTDTLTLVMRKRPVEKKKKKKDDEPEPIVFLGMLVDAPSSMDIFDTVSITFDEPVLDINKEMFSLDQKTDTIWNEIDFDFFPDTTNSLNFFILRPWKYGEEYRLRVDSTVITSLYGKWNDKYSGEFKIKNKDEYGNLYVTIEGVDTTAYAELLSTSDAPVRKVPVKDGGALFMDLKPAKYYVRIVVDLNNNGQWDPGNYAEKRQPEEVFYSPKVYEITQNWDVDETIPWNYRSIPLYKQKPLEITKNKPKEVTKKKRNYKDEGQQSSKSSGVGNMALPF